MSKFTFTCEDEAMPFSNAVVTKRIFEFDAVQLEDIIQEFEMFLRGAGFTINGHLDIVPEEDAMLYNAEATVPEKHSNHYYDTERNKPINSLEKMSNWLVEYDRMGNCSK
jgi:hypothetical protein